MPDPIAKPLVALIAAAGIGSRMAESSTVDSPLPKQYLPLLGTPVLLRSIQAMANVEHVERIIVVLHAQDNHWHSLDLTQVKIDKPIATVIGGDTRAGSVMAGLAHILASIGSEASSADVQVLVHDAARPLVRRKTIERLIKQVADTQKCGGLLAIPASDTLKVATANGDVEKTLDRDLVWQAQTPQLFGVQALYDAIEAALAAGSPVTDEASAMEMAGYHPLLVRGDNDNIKLTHSLDFGLAEMLLRAQEAE